MNEETGHVLQVIHVDETKCVNCHACIAACPVKVCNDGSGDYVSVNPDLCIGCGRCLATCTHGARYFTDDLAEFLTDIARPTRMVAVVAPSAAANFPGQYLRLNGWLKSLGVEAVFDVSFGAELCLKSHAEFIRQRQPRLLITQACPVVVNYVQTHQPGLLKYLAPIDSPMLHTMKMIRRYYPEFNGHRIAVFSPCPAKRREFEQTGFGDYSVTFASVQKHFESMATALETFPESAFVDLRPDKAVLLPAPGGMLRALEAWVPGVRDEAREIHGTEAVYSYLTSLPDTIETFPHSLPRIVDCLNCEHGCSRGPGRVTRDETPDELQYQIEDRYRSLRSQNTRSARGDDVKAAVSAFWQEGLYTRQYADLSTKCALETPTPDERQRILLRMHKFGDEDILDCCSCGYGSCEQMVVAIHNGLNRPENCHHYLSRERELSQSQLSEYRDHLERLVEARTAELSHANGRLRAEIVERRRIEEALFNSERKLTDVVEGSPIPQFVIDRNHVVTYWNKALERLSGLTSQQMVGTNRQWTAFYPNERPCLADLLVDEDAEAVNKLYKGRWKRAALIDGAYEFVDFFPAMGAEGKWLYFTAAVIRDARGEIVGAAETIEDVTDQKEAERELELSQEAAEAANRAKSQFLANMSHEIRTPMTAILGYADLVLENVRREEDIEAVKTIKRNGEHLLAVINDILDLSKVEAGMLTLNQTRCSPTMIVEEVLSLMRVRAEAKNISLDAEYVYPIPATITSDPTRLRQILINLVGNAIKFTEVGGVRVRTALHGSADTGWQLRFDVIDSGIGISDEQKPGLFQPFCQGDTSFNRRAGGTGLGLAISKRLAEAMRGQIHVGSVPKKGSTFSLMIGTGSLDDVQMLARPVGVAERGPSDSTSAEPLATLDCRILLAEDGPDNQRLISFLLRKAGAKVVVAENGDVAVRLTKLAGEERSHRGAMSPFDIILMDMQMPVMDGYEATRQLRNAGYSGPIIALTAHAMSDDRQKCLDAGCTDYMSKPVARDTLLAMVSKHCRKSEVAPPIA